jgi:tetratricopeptide (TPR) repeat protein
MPHVEALLIADPEHDEARSVAQRLLEVKALAGRAAGALAIAMEATGTPADVAKILAIELEHTRGPKRRDVLRRLGILRQDRLGDDTGAYEAFEQALALDAADEELLRRYVDLASSLGKQLDAARALTRYGAAARDPQARARLAAEVGDLYLSGSDAKRARASFVGVLALPDVPTDVQLRVSRALCAIYAAERDFRSLADSLERVALLEPNDELRQTANEELAELAQTTLRDAARAITAWRRLVETPARLRALDALEPLYTATNNVVELAFVLEERAKDEPDEDAARTLAFRAAEVLTNKTDDRERASEAWARFSARFGADRGALAAWIPLLEAAGDWARLSMALEGDASLAPDDERAALFVRLGQIRLQRTDDVLGAIDAFAQALLTDPTEAVSRATLEKLAASGGERLAAARVLEPYYRQEQHSAGVLRVLELKASTSPSREERMEAIEEAIAMLEDGDSGRVVDWIARGLREAVAARADIPGWIDRLDAALGPTDQRRRASVLTRCLGDLVIDSPELSLLAKRAAEAHVAGGDVPAGLGMYRRALVYDPTEPELLARVDDLLREQGNPSERVALYRAALVRSTVAERRRELLHSIARVERDDLRDAAAATATYETAVSEDPSDREAVQALAELYVRAERWGTLLALLEGSLAHASVDEARGTRARMAEVALAHGDASVARAHAQAVLDDGAASDAEMIVLERVATGIGDHAMLRAVLARRAALAPDTASQITWLEQLGALELTSASPDSAVATWKRAAELAEGIGDAITARRLYERVRDVSPDDSEAAARLATLLEAAEEWPLLPDLYAIMLAHAEAPSDRIGVLMRHARLLAEHLDDMGGALVSAAQAFELASASTEYRDVLSTFTMLALRGKATHIFAQAMDDAVARNAGDDVDAGARRTELRMAKARVLAANRDGRDAAASAYRAILEDSPVVEAQLKAALFAFESLLSSEAAEARRPDRRWLYAWRAERAVADEEKAAALEAWAIAEETTFGDPEQALQLYRRALALGPENVRVLSSVARLSLGIGDAEGAVTALLAQRDKSDGEARRAVELEIAKTFLHRLARPDDALAAVTRILEDAPDDPGALALAGQLLTNDATRDAMAKVLETAQHASQDPRVRARILRALLDALVSGAAADPAIRRGWFEELLQIYRETEEPTLGFELALAAAQEHPDVTDFWDDAEKLAQRLERAPDVADAYGRALALPVSAEAATLLGERAIAFQEEWFEDGAGVVRILERVLEIDPRADWAFDRLKMLFDAGERWTDLFALYDRAIALAEDSRKAALYEDAAQIAKDFANDSDRAVLYLEQLLILRPTEAHLVASLERLYERKGAHRELVKLLSSHLTSQSPAEAQRTRGRIAQLWLDDLKDPDRALEVAEDIQRHREVGKPDGAPDPVALIERVMSLSPRGPGPEGSGEKPVRYRAAALLRAHYEQQKSDADLARLFEIELEIATSHEDLVTGHRKIATFYSNLAEYSTALEHLATLSLLEPDVAAHRVELAEVAAKVNRYDRLAEVLVKVSEKSASAPLRAELMTAAGDVWVTHLRDEDRAIGSYLSVLATPSAPPALVLEAARKVEPLLERANRSWDLLDVLERLAALEGESAERARAWTLAARLATSFGEHVRAITAWEASLKEREDSEALDSLIELLERESRWSDLLAALEKRAATPRTSEERRRDRTRIASVLQDRIGDLEAAVKAWTATEAEFGANDESTDALSRLLEKTERWPELEAKLAEAASRAETPERRAQVLARLGDVARVHGKDPDRARASYTEALEASPQEAGARAGLLTLATSGIQAREVVRVLLAAYVKTRDSLATLAITELRLTAADGDEARIDILLESAGLAEGTGDLAQAFDLQGRAFALAPDRPAVADEFARLARATGGWARYAEAHVKALEAHTSSPAHASTFGDPAWRAAFRHRLAKVEDAELADGPGALAVYEVAVTEAPDSLEIALSTIDLAGRMARWSVAATAIVRVSSAQGKAIAETLARAEERAQGAASWDELTHELEHAIAAASAAPAVARDLEAALGAWHRDRRGDPDAAEAALTRALAYDSANADLLSALAQIQRRAKGRPLVDSLVRLSQATGGDLELLREAAEVVITTLADRALAKSILTSLLTLAESRWVPSEDAQAAEEDSAGPVSVGAAASPAPIVRWAIGALAQIHGDDGHPEQTIDLLTTSARLPWSTAEARQMLHQAARIARDEVSDAARATTLYEGLFETDPADEEAVSALTRLYETNGRNVELLRLRARLVEIADDPNVRVALRLASATLEASLGHPEAAIALLRSNLTDVPRDDATTTTLAEVLSTSTRWSDLAELFATQASLADAAGATKVAADWWVRAASVAEQRLSDPDAAIRSYRRALALDERTTCLDDLARLLAARGDHAAAAETLSRLLGLAGEERVTPLTLRYVAELSAAGDGARARAELETACRAKPDDRDLGVRLVEMYTSQGAWDALADLHRRSAEAAPDKARKLTHLRAAADLLIHRCKTADAAIPLLEEAAELDPDDRATKLILSDALVHAAKFTEARALLRSIIDSFGGRRPKERGIAHYHLALLEIATQNRPQALVELEAATKIDPGNARILRALAEHAREDGQIDRAERSYRALLVALKRPEDSAEDAEIVRSEVLLALSMIAAAQGQPDRARELLESALETAARSLVEARRLEAGLRDAKDFPTLVRALEARLARAAADEQRVEVLTELARVQDVELGHLAAAFDSRQKALELTPGVTAAHDASLSLARRVDGVGRYVDDVVRLAEVDERAGRSDAACALFLRAGSAVEADLKDDARAAALYERGLTLVAPGVTSEGAPPSSRFSRQALMAIRAVDPVYARLGRTEERLRLLAKRVALESTLDDPAAAADARYRLAELLITTPDGALEAGLLITQALELGRDLDRAEAIVRDGLARHAGEDGLIDILESIGRQEGREGALLDALEARSSREGAAADVTREAASIARKIGDAARAEKLLTKYVEADDQEAGWAFEELADLREASSDMLGAIAWKKRAAEVAGQSDARRLRFDVTRMLEAVGDLAGAAAVYELLFDEEPFDRAAFDPMLAAYRKVGDVESVVRLLPRVIEQASGEEERSRLRLERVRLMVSAQGKRDEAIPLLADLVTDDPNHAEAAAFLADLYQEAGQTDDLKDLLGRQIDTAKDRQDAKQIEALSLRRAALLATTDGDEARATLYSALDWTPESREVLQKLVDLLKEPGMESERLDVLERLLPVTEASDVERAALELSELRAAEGNPEAAERALEIGYRANPSSKVLFGRLESSYRAANATEKLAELKELEARSVTDPVARVARLRDVAELYTKLPDHARAARVLAEAFAAKSTDLALAGDLVAALVRAGDLPAAVTTLTDALELAKDDAGQRATLLLERANLRLELQKDDEAAADLMAVARLGVINVARALDVELERVRARAEARGDGAIERSMRLELATVRAEALDLDGARPLVAELLRKEPKDRDALRLLARIEERAERWDAATVAYRRLIPLEEGDLAVDTALRLADACERAGRLADARGALERTRSAAPHDQALRLRLERLYESIGAFRELAEMSFNDAREAASDEAKCNHLKRAGALLLQDGTDTEAAIDALADAQALAPGDLECALLLADAYTVAGKTTEAQALIAAQITARAGRRSPELASLYHRLARIAHVLGDRAAELAALTSGLEADAQNGFVAAELASAALEGSDVELATRALRAITLLKDGSTSHISKGVAYQYLGEIARQQGDAKRAMLLLKRAVEDDPSLEAAHRLIEELRAEGT